MQSEFKNQVIPPKIAGIKSALPNHSVAWQINLSFGMQFGLTLDWIKASEGDGDSLHGHYFCQFEDVELCWHLIRNKGSRNYLLKTNPLFDFFLVCNGEDIYGYFDRAVASIRENPAIEHIYPFSFDRIPSKDQFFENFLRTPYFIEDLHV